MQAYFLALAGARVKGYDTDRDIFLGPYGTYSNPLAVREGKCNNSLAVGDNGCGALQTDIELQPARQRTSCTNGNWFGRYWR